MIMTNKQIRLYKKLQKVEQRFDETDSFREKFHLLNKREILLQQIHDVECERHFVADNNWEGLDAK